MNRKISVAYVQDWLTVVGGAERVTREIMLLYPDADVFSLIDFLSPEDRNYLLQGRQATTTFIQRLPFARKGYRMYLPLFPRAIESLDLSGYDLIISSSYSVAKGVKTSPGQKHLCYCHSPVRYAWDLREDYLKQIPDPTGITQSVMRFFLKRLRRWDRETSKRVTRFLANSGNVKERIQRHYNRESTVVYPPLDLEKFKIGSVRMGHYITASRLVDYKRIDLIVEAFRKMPEKKLKVLGDGPQRQALMRLASGSPNIEISGHVSEENLTAELQSARAFIMAAHEDFGIAPIEAQACGTPVIAFGKGGILETTTERKTAVYFNEQTPAALISAVNTFENTTLWSPEEIRASVMLFDKNAFRSNFQKEVETCLSM